MDVICVHVTQSIVLSPFIYNFLISSLRHLFRSILNAIGATSFMGTVMIKRAKEKFRTVHLESLL